MLSSCAGFVIFIGLLLLLWRSAQKALKQAQKPLSKNIKKHYFIKTVLNSTDEIRKWEREKIESLITKDVHDEQSIFVVTDSTLYKYQLPMFMAFGWIGWFLAASSLTKASKLSDIEKMEEILADYLARKTIEHHIRPDKKREITMALKNRVAHLLNVKVLSVTGNRHVKQPRVGTQIGHTRAT